MRISSVSIEDYLGEGWSLSETRRILKVPSLLQNDYGEVYDCSLTSLTAYIGYLKPLLSIDNIYSIVEAIAKTKGYNGITNGTNPLRIRSIFNEALVKVGINRKTDVRYLKNIGFNFNSIKSLVKQCTPAVLSLWSDGRNYYHDHSVLIVGYSVYTNSKNQTKRFLQVFDNWTADYSYIDYDKLSTIASINYLKAS